MEEVTIDKEILERLKKIEVGANKLLCIKTDIIGKTLYESEKSNGRCLR